MKYLKSFFESSEFFKMPQEKKISKKSLEILKSTYLYLCDLVQDMKDDLVKVNLHTSKFDIGVSELNPKNLDDFLIICMKLNVRTYELEFTNLSFGGYRVKNSGKFPDWFIDELNRIEEYLKSEGYYTQFEVKQPNREYEMGMRGASEYSSQYARPDELNKWFSNAVSILLIFSRDRNPRSY
jgi:hypothetical protein